MGIPDSAVGSAIPEEKAPALVGRRQANKLDKLDRIKRAARDLFTSHGYDEATTRQIASRADVALGTVFSYASNKRDLLFLVANDLLNSTRERAQARYRPQLSLLESFVAYFGLHYRALGADPPLSRLILRELLFYDSGVQAIRAKDNRALLLKNVETMIVDAYHRGEIELPADAALVAGVMFAVLQAELRRWLSGDEQDLAQGLRSLWAAEALVIRGLTRRDVPAKPAAAVLRRLMAA
jgi:AcrR family transcriptional regulator